MKCIKCGEELEANARFCKFCGQKAESEELTATKKPIEDSTPEEAPPSVFEDDNEATVLLESEPSPLAEAPVTDTVETSVSINGIKETVKSEATHQSGKEKLAVGKILALCFAGGMVLIGLILGVLSLFIGQSGWGISSIFSSGMFDTTIDEYAYDSFGDSVVDSYIGDIASTYDSDEYDYRSDEADTNYYSSTAAISEAAPEYESDIADDYYYEESVDEAVTEEDIYTPIEDYNNYYYEAEAEAAIEEVNDNNKVVIAYGGLRLRDNPDIDNGKKIGLIPDGTIITVESTLGNWAYTNYNGISGWCSCDFLFPVSTYSGKALYSAMVSIYPGVELVTNNYFDGKNVTTTIPYSATVYVYETSGNSAFVSYNNIYGWCATDYLVH